MTGPAAACGAESGTAALPDPYPVLPARRAFAVDVAPPGSKSETNRMYALAALADGTSRIVRPLRAHDPDLFLGALCASGAGAEWAGESVLVRGTCGSPAGGCRAHLGDGGAPARFMLAMGALSRSPVLVDGSARLRERPVAEGVEMLRAAGATVRYAEAEGRLPIEVGGTGTVRGGTVEVARTASSQFLSAMLLVAPWTQQGIRLVMREGPTSASYVELTIDTMRRFGVPVSVERDPSGRLLSVRVDPHRVAAADVAVEPDASGAVYFLAAAAAIRDARATIRGLPRTSRQPDTACIAALVAMGAREITVPGGIGIEGTDHLSGIDLDGSRWPDGALSVCAIAALARGVTRIRGLETLRVKESNRVAALAAELAKFGCAVSTTDSTIAVDPAGLHGRPVTVDSHGDHRVAMSFAALGVARPGVSVTDPGCVAKSYPGFWSDLRALCGAGS
jgi:3-phosphoshikimate 1-carboxyvinyltransferase